MPVIELSLAGLKARTRNKVSEKEILEALPYLGLDIEDQTEDKVSVEYSPNRPDFSSEAGIARSLVGLLGIETGLPQYTFSQSQIRISVEGREIQTVRPHIFALYASLNVTDEVIKQLIVMQEDLHNGIGRHRSKVAIGIHNAAMVRPPIKYLATDDRTYSFVPLGASEKRTIQEIIETTEQGRAYGHLLSKGLYPLLIDSSGNTLSMPPIINGELTRLKYGVRSIFVDVTATDRRVGDVTIAIIASMLADIGARVELVRVEYEDGRVEFTPDMMSGTMKFDLDLVNSILGLDLSWEEARTALEKSRVELMSQALARIPRYRSDVLHPIDLVEDVELGYGVWKLKPHRTRSSFIGSETEKTKKLRRIVEILVGLGLTEIVSLSLTSEDELFVKQGKNLKVEDPKSKSYEFLRSEALPSLLGVLGRSTHEEYPQKIFEQVAVFRRSDTAENRSVEEEHVAAAIAEASANFTRIRSTLDGFLRLALPRGYDVLFVPVSESQGREEEEDATASAFASGRAARLYLTKGKQQFQIGVVGEISPEILQRLEIRIPVAAFEIDLSRFIKD